MISDVAKEQLRQLKAQKAALQNSIADAQARVVVVDAQLAALEPLVKEEAPQPAA